MKDAWGKIVGGALFAGATLAIWMWPDGTADADADAVVRPVRSMVVEAGRRMPDLHFTGRVKASEDRTLCFKQSGRILRLPVKAGQKISKGDRLAWLDPKDFEDDLAKAEAAELRDRLSCERKREAAKKNAVSKEEVSQAEAQLKQAEAQLALARRALEETVLYAPFDGAVAEVPANELDMVGPSTKIVLVHDLAKVKIDVVMPENAVITSKRVRAVDAADEESGAMRASFDSVPGRSFPVRFVEYVANADTKTQTFLATYEMDAPDDLLLLPGMSATLTLPGDRYFYDDEAAREAVALPESAVGATDDGRPFVWVLERTEAEGVFTAHRRTVSLDSRQKGDVTVTGGLKAGERVATAGVSVLDEGRRVRLLAK